MPSPAARAARAFFPEAPLVAAAVITSRVPAAHTAIAGFTPVFAATVLVCGLLLGWRFRRSRLAFTLVLLALAWLALPRAHSATSGTLLYAAAALLPLNLLALGVMAERGVFTPPGLRYWAAIALQAGVVLGATRFRPEVAGAVARLDLLAGAITAALHLPAPALLAFALAAALLGTLWYRDPNSAARGLFWVLALAYAALATGVRGPAAELCLAAGGLVLIVDVVQSSYHSVYHDALTGLPGRRAFDEALLRLGDRYAVAMIDVDHFKRCNDQYGHDVGDHVLRMVAGRLAEVPGGGAAYRYGGEEFAVLFPGGRVDEAREPLEQLRRAVAERPFAVRGLRRPRKKPDSPVPLKRPPKRVAVTISIGVAERAGHAQTTAQVVAAADRALYAAKQGGRNRVCE